MPASGTITSWSTIVVVPVGGRATLKVFRRTADPTSFQVVGHDGPETLSQLGTVTFPASIPVKPGDLLGIHPVDTVKCAFASPGSEVRYAVSNAQDGQAATLGMTGGNALLDIQATFVPDNSFSLGKPKLNKNGTATITAKVPNPGKLTGSGKGVKVAGAAVISKKVSAPGKVKLTIRATGKKKTTLNETGKVKVKAKITYTPTGGDSATQSKTVRLKKKL